MTVLSINIKICYALVAVHLFQFEDLSLQLIEKDEVFKQFEMHLKVKCWLQSSNFVKYSAIIRK